MRKVMLAALGFVLCLLDQKAWSNPVGIMKVLVASAVGTYEGTISQQRAADEFEVFYTNGNRKEITLTRSIPNMHHLLNLLRSPYLVSDVPPQIVSVPLRIVLMLKPGRVEPRILVRHVQGKTGEEWIAPEKLRIPLTPPEIVAPAGSYPDWKPVVVFFGDELGEYTAARGHAFTNDPLSHTEDLLRDDVTVLYSHEGEDGGRENRRLRVGRRLLSEAFQIFLLPHSAPTEVLLIQEHQTVKVVKPVQLWIDITAEEPVVSVRVAPLGGSAEFNILPNQVIGIASANLFCSQVLSTPSVR